MKGFQIRLGLGILALGLLLGFQGIRATESSDVDSSASPVEDFFSQTGHLSLPVTLERAENFSFGAVTESPDDDIARATQGDAPSASELNRKLANPVSSIWSIRISSTTSS